MRKRMAHTMPRTQTVLLEIGERNRNKRIGFSKTILLSLCLQKPCSIHSFLPKWSGTSLASRTRRYMHGLPARAPTSSPACRNEEGNDGGMAQDEHGNRVGRSTFAPLKSGRLNRAGRAIRSRVRLERECSRMSIGRVSSRSPTS